MAGPAAVEIINAEGRSPIVLTCEHAARHIPARYAGLGLSESDLTRHIAWDIGAADVARRLAALIDAPLFLSGYSRLLIDCNRPLGSETSIPSISEDTPVPGNMNLAAQEIRHRADAFYWPFQNAVAAHLDRRRQQGRATRIVGIHSFTPVFRGIARPWHAGILFRKSQQFGNALVEALGGDGLSVAANQPYTIDDDDDYTVPVHGEARGLDAVLVEIRQDLIADGGGAGAWADRLARPLGRASRWGRA
jgi:predicted N-formylglutamate amidohydrolase